MFKLENLIYYSSMLGGILLSVTLIWVAIYNFRISQTKKASLFLLSGLSLGILLIYNILFPQ
jgi:predicted membrane chloride channel (bestrophin family)